MCSINLYSQEIGISSAKVWTDNYEIENPIGFSAYYFQPIGRFGLKLEYFSASNERNYYGFLVSGFWAPEYYSKESVLSKSTYRAIELSFQIQNIVEVFQSNVNIGLGITSDKFGCSRNGKDSRREVSVGEENKLGIFYSVSISKNDCFGLPIKLEILYKHKGMKNVKYVTDSEQLFVSLNDVKRLQLNIAYVF